MIDIRDIYQRWIYIIDKYGDPSFTDLEFSTHFNNSSYLVFLESFNSQRQRQQLGTLQYAFEMSETDADKWRTLVKPLTLNTNAQGIIQVSAIEAAFPGRQLFHLSCKQVNGRYARYVRQNDYGRMVQNQFVEPSEDFPIVRQFGDYFKFEPVGVKPVEMVCVLYPNEVLLDNDNPANNINADLTWSAVMDVLLKMGQIAGIQIREQQLYQETGEQESKL
jgi:hypothetical protein